MSTAADPDSDISALSFEQALAELEKIVMGPQGQADRAEPADFS